MFEKSYGHEEINLSINDSSFSRFFFIQALLSSTPTQGSKQHYAIIAVKTLLTYSCPFSAKTPSPGPF